MSLIHWWPLTEDLNDKIGLTPLVSSQWFLENDSTKPGKIGKCYNANEGNTATIDSLTLPNTFSFACWIKNYEMGYPRTTLPMQFGQNPIQNSGSIGWDYAHRTCGKAAEVTGNEGYYDYRVTLNDGIKPVIISWSKAGYNPPDLVGKWHHIAVSVDYDNKKIALYINGACFGIQDIPPTFLGTAGTHPFKIGNVQGWKMHGYINDLRIYDHALSAAEVQELKKALVVHYTFEDELIEDGMLYNETGLVQANESSSLELSYEAAIGTHSLSNGANKYFNIPVVGDISAGATASLWVKVKSYPKANAVVFADANSLLAFGFYGTQNAIISCKTSKPYISNIKSKWKTKTDGTPEWNHVVVQRLANAKIDCYLNGVRLSPSTSTTNWTHYKNCTIGCRYNDDEYKTNCECYIDDFRLYHSLLTENEIKELYNCGGRISNLGDALTGSFIEGESAIKVNKNHTIQAEDIYEYGLPDGYKSLEYIDFQTTDSIDTGVAPGTSLSFDVLVANISANAYVVTQYNYGLRLTTHFTNYVQGRRFKITSFVPAANTTYRIQGSNDFISANKIDGVQESDNDNPSGNVLLFDRSQSSGRLYFCRLWSGDTLIRYLIPAKRISDNAIGLYDVVSETFFTSPGLTGKELNAFNASFTTYNELISRNIIEI